MTKIRIAIADDQHLFRDGLASLIQSFSDFDLVAQASNGRELLERIAALPEPPDIVLADMNMPEMNGVELNAVLHEKYPPVKVIMLTVYDQERFIIKMIEAGANGYLIKNSETDELVTAIRTVHTTGFYFNQAALQAMRHSFQYKNAPIKSLNNIPIELTEREKEVLELICQELTNTEIAEKLFLSARTVEGYRNNMLVKTGCKNTAGLVIFAIRYGIYHVGLPPE
jgi:DNA-binding NarL/FixJ family response regulator